MYSSSYHCAWTWTMFFNMFTGNLKFERRRSGTKNQKYACQYCMEWQNDNRLKYFIHQSKKGGSQFYCSLCVNDVSVASRGINDLIRYTESKKHKSFKNATKHNLLWMRCLQFQLLLSYKFKYKLLKQNWAAFATEHDTAFQLSDNASDLFKTMFPDSKIVPNFHSKITKSTSVVKHVLDEISWSEFIKLIQRNKFSFIVYR